MPLYRFEFLERSYRRGQLYIEATSQESALAVYDAARENDDVESLIDWYEDETIELALDDVSATTLMPDDWPKPDLVQTIDPNDPDLTAYSRPRGGE